MAGHNRLRENKIMEKNEIMEIINEQLSQKSIVESESKDANSAVLQEIEKAYSEHRASLQKDEHFQKGAKEVVTATAKAKMRKDMLEALSEEQRNELSLYILQKEKQQLDYRKKKERGLILEETRAEISNRRIETLKMRYGYMYNEKEPFIPSKSYNKSREFANWWNSTSDNFRKLVKGTLKFLLYATIGFLVVYFGYKGLSWIMANTNLPNK